MNFPHFRSNRPSSQPAHPNFRSCSPHGPTSVFFLLTAPAERRLRLAPPPHPRRHAPPPLVQDPPPSTIKPQPLPSLNQSFMTLKSPFTPPPISPLMPAIIVARHPPRAPIKGEPPPWSTLHHSPSPSPPPPHQNTPPLSSDTTTTSP
jgi:hypothetical protein